MKDFDNLMKIALECGRFGQINCCQRLWKVAESPINYPIWSHCSPLTLYDIPWSSLIEGDEGLIDPSGKLLCLWQTKKIMQHMLDNIPYTFDCGADQVVHLLLLKSSMDIPFILSFFLCSRKKCFLDWSWQSMREDFQDLFMAGSVRRKIIGNLIFSALHFKCKCRRPT